MFLAFACTCWFVAGFMAGGVCTIIFGYLPIFYPENLIRMQAYFEISFCLASIAGSVLGGLMYEYIGFEYPFYIVGCSYILIGCPVIYFIPNTDSKDQKNLENK